MNYYQARRESTTSLQLLLLYVGSTQHLFYQCNKNNESGIALLRCVQSYGSDLTQVKTIRLELTADDPFLLASISLLSSGFELIWENRKVKRAELETAISTKRRSSLRKLRESAVIMENMVENFLN